MIRHINYVKKYFSKSSLKVAKELQIYYPKLTLEQLQLIVNLRFLQLKEISLENGCAVISIPKLGKFYHYDIIRERMKIKRQKYYERLSKRKH